VVVVATLPASVTRHAPFRRVIELAVSRSALVTVSFPGRACHPLDQFNERRDGR
jgi:hypothetical protein